jgi:hypothetical protein
MSMSLLTPAPQQRGGENINQGSHDRLQNLHLPPPFHQLHTLCQTLWAAPGSTKQRQQP